MADNVAITAGSGTAIAADDVSSVYFQKIKVDIGGDGVSVPLDGGQEAMAASIPVVIASNQTAIPVTTVIPGTAATNLGKAEDAAHTTGDTGVFVLGVANEAQSSLAADGDYIALATDVKGNHLMVGNLAHDAVDAGFPVKMGAQARTTLPTAVADADRVNLITNKYGELATVHSIREMRANQVTTITASVAETTIVTAVASFTLDLYGLIITNTSATAVNVAIKDATGGTTRLNIAVPAGDTRGFMLPACDGIKQATANNNWTATSSASVSSLVITALTKQTT